MLIRDWMTRNPTVVSPTDTLAVAKRAMEKGNFRRLPVMERGALVGIISDRDVRQQTGQIEHIRTDAVMTREVITGAPEMLLDHAADLLLKHKIGGLPVVEGKKLVGIITVTDLLRAFTKVLGTAEEGVSRIDLAFSGNSFDLSMIANLVGQTSGELLGMGSYATQGDQPERTVYIRVRSADAREVADVLTDNGFEVVAIHD
jgi:acetoin utilization protein AcuB